VTSPAGRRLKNMDFIERIFGVSPDGGNGSTEFTYVAALFIAVAIVIASIVLKKGRGSTYT
jgi:hypothetical protein